MTNTSNPTDTTPAAPDATALSRRLNQRIMRVYDFYRIVLAVVLALTILGDLSVREVGMTAPMLFLGIALLYLAGALFVPLVNRPSQDPTTLLRGFVFLSLDTLVISTLMTVSGGVASGLGTLNLITVASGNMIWSGRIGQLLAAIATLEVMAAEIYLHWAGGDTQSADFFQAGILGALYFITALTMQYLTQRIRSSDVLTAQQARDIADLQSLNQSIVQRMRTGILVIDAQGQVRTINQAAAAWLQVPVDSPPPVPHFAPALWERFRTWQSAPQRQPANLAAQHGAPELEVNFAPLGDDPSADVLVFLEDHALLAQQAQHLKLASLGRLSASIAHEIRNPLSAVSHAAQLIADAPERNNLDRLTHIIVTNCERMNAIIESVLSLSRRSPPHPQNLALRRWLEEFVADYREQIDPDAELPIQVEPDDAHVNVDPSQLRQVLTNLVDNGLRYSRSNHSSERVSLKAGIDARLQLPYLEVSDTGPGVAADALHSLFEPFHTTEHSGTGLGLFLARELCQANQAHLQYQPSAGGGACFRITFSHPDRYRGTTAGTRH
ncbi:MAG: ATP-binding protein [Pseudomonadota bacterium]|nr:ATP-binding protein [Pseudomonadota bacterium]